MKRMFIILFSVLCSVHCSFFSMKIPQSLPSGRSLNITVPSTPSLPSFGYLKAHVVRVPCMQNIMEKNWKKIIKFFPLKESFHFFVWDPEIRKEFGRAYEATASLYVPSPIITRNCDEIAQYDSAMGVFYETVQKRYTHFYKRLFEVYQVAYTSEEKSALIRHMFENLKKPKHWFAMATCIATCVNLMNEYPHAPFKAVQNFIETQWDAAQKEETKTHDKVRREFDMLHTLQDCSSCLHGKCPFSLLDHLD